MEIEIKIIDSIEQAKHFKNDIEEFSSLIKYKDNYDIDYNNPATLVHCIYTSKRFVEPNGELNLIYDNGKLIGVGGVEKSGFNDEIALMCRRLSYIKKYRTKGLYTKYLLPIQIEWCIKNKIKLGLFTWNKDRKTLYDANKRLVLGKPPYLGYKYGDKYYNKLVTYDGIYIIKNTPQYIAGYILDRSFKWDPKEDLEYES